MKVPNGRSSSSPVLLSDADVRIHLDAPTALAAIRRALVAHHEGALVAPARFTAELGRGSGLVFTAGQLEGECHGFRVYGPDGGSEQLVALWDSARGRVRALVTGHELGVRRTGAIGAVAEMLSRRAAAGGIALVNTVGSLSGFAAPYVTGWLKDYSGSTRPGLWLAGAMMILSAGLVAMLSRSRPGQVEDSAVAATTPVAPVLIAAPETPQQASTH
jgi:hypothetical protein